MTALALDIRGPIIVMIGAFNPAIFTRAWIATNIFGIAEGTELAILEVLIQVEPQAVLGLGFIEGVAINVSLNRMEFYTANDDPATFETLEGALTKVLETLPHTPVQGIGCNFRWVDSDPSAEVTDLFDTQEGLEGRFELVARQFSTQLRVDDATLNFSRASMNGEVHFIFNYHRPVTSVTDCGAAVKGMITKDLAHSTNMISSVYKYDGHQTLIYTGTDQHRENDHAAEIAG